MREITEVKFEVYSKIVTVIATIEEIKDKIIKFMEKFLKTLLLRKDLRKVS